MRKKFYIHSTRGFTLVELLVVLAISSLLVGVSITSYVSVNNRQGIEQDAQSFKQFFDEAKNNATSFVKPVQCVGATPSLVVKGYQVSVDTTGKKLTMQGVCVSLSPTPIGTSPTPTPNLTPTVKTLDLSKYTVAIVDTTSSGCRTFLYGVLKNQFVCAVGSENQPVERFTITGNGITKTLEVDSNGNMQIL